MRRRAARLLIADELQAGAHLQQIAIADRAARIARRAPERHGRRLIDRVRAVLDEQREQRGRDALPHRPALELRVLGHARRVALGDDAALVDDEKGLRERRGIGKRGVERLRQQRLIHARRPAASCPARSPIGHGCVAAAGSVVRTGTGLK